MPTRWQDGSALHADEHDSEAEKQEQREAAESWNGLVRDTLIAQARLQRDESFRQ